MPVANPDSVLDSVKQALGLTPDVTQFDLDVTMHINSVIGSLLQMGVSNNSALYVPDNTTPWAAITTRQDVINLVKTYMYLKVRMIFDPPDGRYALPAVEKIIEELEWRIVSTVESTPVIPVPTWWDLTGLLDFPSGAQTGDFGFDTSTWNIYVNVVQVVKGYWWDLTGLSDFPAEAAVGDLGYDTTTGQVWRKTA